MEKKGYVKLIEILSMIAMGFGWLAMLSKIALSETYEILPFNPVSYGFIIFLIATPVFMIVSARKTLNEWLSISLILFGMFSLCQPFTMFLYRCGFQTLLVGTLGFIVASHR
jgi:hypothetical protein